MFCLVWTATTQDLHLSIAHAPQTPTLLGLRCLRRSSHVSRWDNLQACSRALGVPNANRAREDVICGKRPDATPDLILSLTRSSSTFFFSVVYFSRGTSPKKGARRALSRGTWLTMLHTKRNASCVVAAGAGACHVAIPSAV